MKKRILTILALSLLIAGQCKPGEPIRLGPEGGKLFNKLIELQSLVSVAKDIKQFNDYQQKFNSIKNKLEKMGTKLNWDLEMPKYLKDEKPVTQAETPTIQPEPTTTQKPITPKPSTTTIKPERKPVEQPSTQQQIELSLEESKLLQKLINLKSFESVAESIEQFNEYKQKFEALKKTLAKKLKKKGINLDNITFKMPNRLK